MKIKFLYVLLFAFAIISSCTGKKSIVKKWTLDHIDASALIADVPPEMKDTLQNLINVESNFQKGKMIFDVKENGKITITSPDLEGKWEKINGTWILNEESQLLIIQIKGKKDEYIVHELTDNSLIVEQIDRRADVSISGMSKGKRQGTKVKSIFK